MGHSSPLTTIPETTTEGIEPQAPQPTESETRPVEREIPTTRTFGTEPPKKGPEPFKGPGTSPEYFEREYGIQQTNWRRPPPRRSPPEDPYDSDLYETRGRQRDNEKGIKMKLPDSFDGKPIHLAKFLMQCALYLQMNRNIYDTNEKKIAFVISYMDQGPALTWAENYLTTHSREDAFELNSYKDFIEEVIADFKDVTAETDSLFALEGIRQEGRDIQEHNANFEQHLVRSKVKEPFKDEGLIKNMYLRSLDQELQRRVMQATPTPITLKQTMGIGSLSTNPTTTSDDPPSWNQYRAYAHRLRCWRKLYRP